MNNGEFTMQWETFSSADKAMVVDSLAVAFSISKTKTDTLLRIFNLAKPEIIIGKNDTGAYCRLAETSRDVVTVLMREYL